ncbi:hypothetical protein ACE6H2_006199 [Prunus campanulata]
MVENQAILHLINQKKRVKYKHHFSVQVMSHATLHRIGDLPENASTNFVWSSGIQHLASSLTCCFST